jgi:putative hydrolase of the HAD superfamily
MRCHTPRLRLPAETIQVLATLRAGWRIGVLTNGQPAMQRRKVAALGLQAHVDAIVFANECGDGRGKPDPSAFRAVLDRLAASPERSVFVGDDLDADLVGASRAGMHAIHLTAHRPIPSASAACRVRVDCLREVPLVAAQLVQGGDRVGIV